MWESIYKEGYFLEKPPLKQDQVRKIIEQVNEETIPHFVVEIDGEIIASSEVFPSGLIDSTYKEGSVGLLGIMVHKTFRSKGIGQKLLKKVLLDCCRYGYTYVQLTVYKSNTTAINFYKTAGFEYKEDAGKVTLPSGITVESQKMNLKL